MGYQLPFARPYPSVQSDKFTVYSHYWSFRMSCCNVNNLEFFTDTKTRKVIIRKMARCVYSLDMSFDAQQTDINVVEKIPAN